MQHDLVVRAFGVGDLTPYHRNPRVGNVEAIAASLEARGQYRPIVVNLGSHTGRALEVLAGNHTLLAARSLGWSTVQATTVDVTDEVAAQIVLADNRLADLGTYNDEELLAVLEQASDLTGTGYTDRDLALLMRDLDVPVALTDVDDVPDLPTDPSVSQPGDVWQLGPHRLLVGDSGDVLRVQLLMGQEPADVVWTDPPYGVNYVGRTGEALTFDNDSAVDAARVFSRACPTMVACSRPGAPVYVCHSDVVREEFIDSLSRVGISFRQTLIWVKDSMVLSHADYHYRHEPILAADAPEGDELELDYDNVSYGFTAGGTGRLGRGGQRWFGDNKQTTVFEVARPKRALVHPTMKPVELVETMLRNSCPPGGIVLDLFAGSGTTMIAAHRVGARARLVELDPRYADVICQRWEEHTGIVPIRDGVEVSFAAVIS